MISERKHIHLIGIGGTGLSAIAKVLLEQGHIVSGSDMQRSPLSDAIEAAGATVSIGHHAANIQGADLIIQSSAIPASNPEVIAAKTRGIPVLKRSAFLKEWLLGQDCLAVAGTHGKTTTTSMLAWVLESLKLNPGFIIGSVAKNLGTNARAGNGAFFVIEADEYDYMFHGLHPKVAIVTNLQHDHPDCFPTMEIYRKAFQDFTENIVAAGHLIVCADDPEAVNLKNTVHSDVTVRTYGFHPDADYHITSLPVSETYNYSILEEDMGPVKIQLKLSGTHNALNATAVIATVSQLGLNVEAAITALGEFSGSDRRFDILGIINGVTLIDDYAHHPTEIKATLQAARQRYPQARLWAVWQPHTYTRTITLLDEFVVCFTDADQVLVTDVYAAREKDNTFSGQHLADQIQHEHVHFTPQLEDAVEVLFAHVQPGDVVIVCSAGSAIAINQQLREKLQTSPPANEGKELFV